MRHQIPPSTASLYAVWQSADILGWSEWSEWTTTPLTSGEYIQIEQKTQYGYYHYLLHFEDGTEYGAYPIDSATFNKYLPNYPTTQIGYHTEYVDSPKTQVDTLYYGTGVYPCYPNTHCQGDYNFSTNANFSYSLGTRTVYRQRTAIKQSEQPTLSSVSVVSLPAKTQYVIGESLDTTGLVLSLTYSDGSTKTVTTGFSVNGFSSDIAGEKTVTVTYQEKSASFTVTVKQANVPVDPTAPQVFVSSAKTSSGKQIAVTIMIKNNSGFSYLELTPKYSSALTLVSVTNGELISDFTKGRQYIWISEKNITKDGLLCTLVFEIANGTAEGDYVIDFTLQGCYDYNEAPVALTVVPGIITVCDVVFGDVNGDGVVNGQDVLRLKKYLADYDYDTNTSSVSIGAGADANGDGVINGQDVLRLKRYLADYDYETGTSSVVLGRMA